MAFSFVTTQTILARNAGALYKLELGSTTMNALVTMAGTTTTSMDALLNTLYTNSVGTTSTTTVATELVTNLGITDATIAPATIAYVKALLDNVSYTARGAVVNSILSGFAGITDPASPFTTYATAYNTKVATAEAYAAVSTNTSNSSFTAISTTPSTTGTVFTLTTALDTPAGTSSDDTFIGDFTATATLNAGDQINGGAGTDTLKMYGATAALIASNMPISITNVEVAQFASGTDNASVDLSAWGKTGTGIGTFKFDNVSLMNAKSITTTAGQALSLATGASNIATAGTVSWIASATDTSQTLALNGYQGGTGVTAVALTITGAAATTLNLASTGAANAVSTFTLGAVTNKVVITGDKDLTVGTDLVSSGGATILKTVDASAATGSVAITLAATENAAFAFTGGAGNDSIKFADNGMGALTAGSQLDGGAGTADKIGLLDTALTTAEYTAINTAKNFEVLGLNAAVTVAADSLTSIKQFSLDSNAAQGITNMATGSKVTVTAAHAAVIATGGAVGVNDLTFNVGTALTAGITLGGNITIGQTAVALTSNGTNAAANTITALLNSDNAVYTITGSNDLTISTTRATTTASKYDASAFTGKLVIAGNTAGYAAGSALGDVIIGGSAADTITASINGGTLTGNGGNDNFNVSVAVAGGTASAAITKVTDFTKGDKITFGTTAGAFTTTKVDLSSATTEQAAIDLLVAGSNTDVKWGTYNGFTYVADDVATNATMQATDTVVKLTGTLDLSTSTFASNALTYA